MPVRSLAWRWMAGMLALLAMLAAVLVVAPARAATEVVYVSATGHYVRGVFRDYWDKHGGLPVFGYPLTEEYIDTQTGRVYQYFERARFERASATAMQVDLGLLGKQAVGNRTFASSQPITNSKQRRYFPETRHIVQYGFKETWDAQGLTIFGYPLSDEVDEQLSDGKVHTVQYFERARFEYWPEQPPGQRVLLTLLGRQFAPRELTAPLAPGSPPSAPVGAAPPPVPPSNSPSLIRPVLPASKNAAVSPQAGLPGTSFAFAAHGFKAGEKVGVWLNSPDGSVYGARFQATADSSGSIDGAGIGFSSDASTPLGVWSFVGQGVESGNAAVGYFLIIGDAIGRLPPPQPGVPANVDARVEPPAGRAGTVFFFDAYGFKPGEEVTPSVVASDGTRVTVAYTVKADSKGSIGYAGLYYVTEPSHPLGLWRFEAKGKESGKLSVGYFVLTP